MAQSQKCSGTQTVTNWLLVGPTCVYQTTLIIDGSPITATVALDNTMTTTQIAAAFNGNRTGNTTGTISASLSGNDLLITITDIILTSTASGMYQITASGTGAPCGDFSFQTAFLTCTIIRTGGGGGRPFPYNFPITTLVKPCVCK